MFANRYRLRANRLIKKIAKEGYAVHGKYCLVKYLPHPNKEKSPRLAISVNSKTFKKATRRNYLKRIIRESVKAYPANNLPAFDFLIILKNDHFNEPFYRSIKQDLLTIFKKITNRKKFRKSKTELNLI